MTSKGQVTVPAEVRQSLGLRPGSRLEFRRTGSGPYELLVTSGSIRDFKGMLRAPAVPVTLEQMQEGIAAGAVGADPA